MDLVAPRPDPSVAPTVVRLPANGSTASAEDLRNELVFASVQGRGTEIDASEVQSVGQAVLQLLVAAKLDAGFAGTPISYRDPTPEFTRRVVASRLAANIGLDAEKGEM